jgi:precorrin-2/cobalt-factor-2 C20-methyltransferase
MTTTALSGRCYGVGVGPGDPELMTVKAMRILRSSPVVAYFSAPGRSSNARQVVSEFLTDDQEELHLVYPVTTENLPLGQDYDAMMAEFYDASAHRVAEALGGGQDVAVLCEGDPLFHGSFMYLHNRLSNRFPTEVVPGVPSILAGSAVLGTPLVCLDEVLSVLSGTLSPIELDARLAEADAAVIMKVGRNLEKVRQAVSRAGLLDRAWYVERATMAGERVMPLDQVDPVTAPYFSMVVIPSSLAPTR